MNQLDRLEHDLTAWLSVSAAPRTPIYVDDLLAQTARTRQRPAWLLLERWLPMGTTTLPRRALTPLPWRTIGLLVLLGLLMLAAAAIYVGARMRAVPTPYGVAGNGLVAVESNGDIFLVDPITGERTIAVGGATIDTAPLFSRNGSRLAFLREVDGGRSLWMADADGTGQHQLAAGLSLEVSPVDWSPDGRLIALNDAIDRLPSIIIVPTDGTGAAKTLDLGMPVEGAMFRPPDGSEILFRGTSSAGFGLYAIRPDGTGQRKLTTSNGMNQWDALYFGWSPDGSQVAYQWREGGGDQLLYVAPAEGGTPRSISTVESVGVQWSPDGKTIAFIDGDGAGARHVQVVAADGSGSLFQGPAGDFGNVQWTPDGTKILFESDSGAMLLDPTGGPSQPWSYGSASDWQRLALP
jgi:Tol biopolymer transport system component